MFENDNNKYKILLNSDFYSDISESSEFITNLKTNNL